MRSETVYSRIFDHGWSVEAALTVPVKKIECKRYMWKGKEYTPNELAKIHGGVASSTMRQRLEKMSVDEAMAMPNIRPSARKAYAEKKKKEKLKPPPKPKPVRKMIDRTQCRTCKYRDAYCDCCYSLVEQHCRMFISPPSPHCTVYKRGKSVVRIAALKRQGISKEAM